MEDAPDDRSLGSSRYKVYVLVLLTLVYFLYLMDRMAIVITQELIKEEFGLSDTQMGLVIGTVYGISYGLAGLPMGWLVDRLNRKNLLVSIVAIWSGLTAACALGSSYFHLLIARIGIGAAEAGGSPASLSILTDLFPPARRATVASIFYSGTGIGMVASFFLGGLIASNFGWRAVFLIYGLPGILLAALIFFTVREPERHGRTAGPLVKENIFRTALHLLQTPVLGNVYLGTVLYCLATSSVSTWLIAFLMRVHHLDVAMAGSILALGSGLCGIVGGITIGHLADRARRWGRGGPLFVVGAAAVANLAFGMAALQAGDLNVVIICLCVYGATAIAYSGPTNAVISQLAPATSRGMAFALFALLANMVGSGIGPVAVGLLSDRINTTSPLSVAMQLMLLFNVLSASAYFWAGRSLNRQPETRMADE